MDYKFDDIITFAEASALWKLSDGALRHMIKILNYSKELTIEKVVVYG